MGDPNRENRKALAAGARVRREMLLLGLPACVHRPVVSHTADNPSGRRAHDQGRALVGLNIV